MDAQLTDFKGGRKMSSTWNRQACIYSKNKSVKLLRKAKVERRKFITKQAQMLVNGDGDSNIDLVKQSYDVIVQLASRLNWQGFDDEMINTIDGIKHVLRENGYQEIY